MTSLAHFSWRHQHISHDVINSFLMTPSTHFSWLHQLISHDVISTFLMTSSENFSWHRQYFLLLRHRFACDHAGKWQAIWSVARVWLLSGTTVCPSTSVTYVASPPCLLKALPCRYTLAALHPYNLATIQPYNLTTLRPYNLTLLRYGIFFV